MALLLEYLCLTLIGIVAEMNRPINMQYSEIGTGYLTLLLFDLSIKNTSLLLFLPQSLCCLIVRLKPLWCLIVWLFALAFSFDTRRLSQIFASHLLHRISLRGEICILLLKSFQHRFLVSLLSWGN